LAQGPGFDYNHPIIMTEKTVKDLKAEKRAAALRENLRRRKTAAPSEVKKEIKENDVR
jgi:hypothetical protein